MPPIRHFRLQGRVRGEDNMKEEILKELQEALAKTDCHMLNVLTTSGKTIAMEIITPVINKILQSQKEKLLEMMKEKKINWDTPNREIQDKDYKLGEKIGYNTAIEEMRGKIKNL